ncbi:iron-containing alcohol dehydrogenase [bacterium]|nr:iron-containing alcohol dehydrogenase [bacterium]
MFDFQPTTRVVFGDNAIEQLGELTKLLSGRCVLVVTDRGIVNAGHVERGVRSLEKASIDYAVFDGVEENPTTHHVDAGVQAAMESGPIDAIIGLGGGSAMDCAKGVNFILTNGGKMEDYWGVGKARKPMLPSIGIPTTAGTGSEAQSFALIVKQDTYQKMACGDRKARFRTVILDPQLVQSVPRDVAAVTGMDAIAHAIESYVSINKNPISQMFSKEAWRLLSANYEAVLQEPTLETWGNMLLGAHYAGMGIENSMLGAAHACANPLTAHYGITHGAAVGLMLPHVIRFNEKALNGCYDEIAVLADLDESSEDSGACQLANLVANFRAAFQLPCRLRDCDVDEQALQQLAKEAAQQWTGKFNPRPVDEAHLLSIYQEAY